MSIVGVVLAISVTSVGMSMASAGNTLQSRVRGVGECRMKDTGAKPKKETYQEYLARGGKVTKCKTREYKPNRFPTGVLTRYHAEIARIAGAEKDRGKE